MYTIKQASIRTGVSVPLLRAWERRYGIPSPARTASGYRLYDDLALSRVLRMRDLVAKGWAPSQAAQALIDWKPEPVREDDRSPAGDGGPAGDGYPAGDGGPAGNSRRPAEAAQAAPQSSENHESSLRVDQFVASAAALDDAGLDDAVAEAFAVLPPDEAIARFAMPALRAVGRAWAGGKLDIVGEHAASNVVMRRLGALYEAAGQPASEPEVIVGLPPNGRHEAGALAFAVTCRRAGLRVLYVGPEVPVASWLAVAGAYPSACVVLGAVTDDEAVSAREVVRALRADRPSRLVTVGGAAAGRVGEDTLPLPVDLRAAVTELRARLAR